MTVDPEMDVYDEAAGAFSWSVQERRHIAQSFKQRSLATLPLRFSRESKAAACIRRIAVKVTRRYCRRLQHHGAGLLSRHGGQEAQSQVTLPHACLLSHVSARCALSHFRCRYIDASTDKTLQPVTTYVTSFPQRIFVTSYAGTCARTRRSF
jgi:hypothetical protein